jgi:hypothetical protein
MLLLVEIIKPRADHQRRDEGEAIGAWRAANSGSCRRIEELARRLALAVHLVARPAGTAATTHEVMETLFTVTKMAR